MRRITLFLCLAGSLNSAVVVDRIAVIVNKSAIKMSDIYRDLRVTEFLNGERSNVTIEARRKAAERLIDQNLLRTEITNAGFKWASTGEADALLAKIRQDRFGGSADRMRSALRQYGLDQEELRSQLLWQLTVLRYIDQRFRNGVLVTDEDVRAYYDQRLTDLKRENPKDSSFEALAPKIRESLEGERVNQNFVESMEQSRRRSRIEFMEGAFE